MRWTRTTRLALAASVCLGIAAGVGAFTFGYARGGSYFRNDPAACANCHIMSPQYEGWLRSSHRAVASCNDCHTPASPLGKLVTKAENGLYHSYAFTTGRFDEPLRIRGQNRAIAEAACLRCHGDLVHDIAGPETSCLRCHGSVGHRR